MKKITTTLLGLALAASPALVFAEDSSPSVTAGASANVTTSGSSLKTTNRSEIETEHQQTATAHQETKTTRENDHIGQAKDKANQEIDRRIASLTALLSRLGSESRLTAEQKAAYTANINAQISSLTSLKAQIGNDDATTTLRTDIQSVTKSYRIYALVVPQTAIAAAADRINAVIVSMNAFVTKAQARIAAGATVSADVTAALANISVKTADAKVQADAAVGETANLKPDNGDAALMASNTAALKDAKSKIDAAQADLKAARADVTTVLKGVKGTKGSEEASSTASTNLGASVWASIRSWFGK